MTVTTTHHRGLYSVADVDTDNCRHSSYTCLKSVKRMHGELVRCNVMSHQTSLHVHIKICAKHVDVLMELDGDICTQVDPTSLDVESATSFSNTIIYG